MCTYNIPYSCHLSPQYTVPVYRYVVTTLFRQSFCKCIPLLYSSTFLATLFTEVPFPASINTDFISCFPSVKSMASFCSRSTDYIVLHCFDRMTTKPGGGGYFCTPTTTSGQRPITTPGPAQKAVSTLEGLARSSDALLMAVVGFMILVRFF